MSIFRMVGSVLLLVGFVCGTALAAKPFGLALAQEFLAWTLFLVCTALGAIVFPGSHQSWALLLRTLGAGLVLIGLVSLAALVAVGFDFVAGETGVSTWLLFLGGSVAGLSLSVFGESLARVIAERSGKALS
ncbi:MAG: hypothetical protein HY017_10145 [Betaproteobacteria bacterium]|nr:hypothetical protein [Betaproteobacteria bacterium]